MKPKIYIAGPISSRPTTFKRYFNAMASHLLAADCIPLNPAILPDGLTEPQYMDICFAMIRAADGIHLLEGWENSKGALAELAYAEKLGLAITKDVE